MSTPALASDQIRKQAAITKGQTITLTVSCSKVSFKQAMTSTSKTRRHCRRTLLVKTVRQAANSVRQDKSEICGKPEMDRIATFMFIQ